MSDDIIEDMRDSISAEISERILQVSTMTEDDIARCREVTGEATGQTPCIYFNWRDRSVGFAVNDRNIVIFEMTTTHLEVGRPESIDTLMAAVDRAIPRSLRKEQSP